MRSGLVYGGLDRRNAMRMPSFSAAILAALTIGASPALADGICPDHKSAPRVAAIEAAASCKAADRLDKLCWIGAMADLSPARAVVVKCEKHFLPGLSKRGLARYETDRQVCLKRFEGRRGSGAASARMHCLAAVAVKYAKR
jgi:hypothetical protein